jgi:hypothetical protein
MDSAGQGSIAVTGSTALKDASCESYSEFDEVFVRLLLASSY